MVSSKAEGMGVKGKVCGVLLSLLEPGSLHVDSPTWPL